MHASSHYNQKASKTLLTPLAAEQLRQGGREGCWGAGLRVIGRTIWRFLRNLVKRENLWIWNAESFWADLIIWYLYSHKKEPCVRMPHFSLIGWLREEGDATTHDLCFCRRFVRYSRISGSLELKMEGSLFFGSTWIACSCSFFLMYDQWIVFLLPGTGGR